MSDALVQEWREGAAERERLIKRASNHGVGTVEYRRWMAKDSVVGRRMLALGDELRSAGIDPHAIER
jgi:hypothetical protein